VEAWPIAKNRRERLAVLDDVGGVHIA
jgi:hypothetical protein